VIHYHGTPCGGQRPEVARFLSGRHALIPWVRNEDIGTAAEVCQSFCLDNGAFSAWKSGKPIKDWKPYFQWVKDWSRHPGFDWAIIPDVIDGDELANDKLIAKWVNWDGWRGENWHCEGVPVWHLHESLERLERLAMGWPRVAIGSSGDWPTPGTQRWWLRMADVMSAVCDDEGRPRCKLHGLRMLDPAIFTRLPLNSADSTNAVRNSSNYSRYGQYCPPNAGTRMFISAERTERHQSSAIWVKPDVQGVLVFTELETGGVKTPGL